MVHASLVLTDRQPSFCPPLYGVGLTAPWGLLAKFHIYDMATVAAAGSPLVCQLPIRTARAHYSREQDRYVVWPVLKRLPVRQNSMHIIWRCAGYLLLPRHRNVLSPQRTLTWLSKWLGSLFLLVLVAVPVFFPSYSHPPARYSTLAQACGQSGRSGCANPRNQSVFISVSLHDGDGSLAGGC